MTSLVSGSAFGFSGPDWVGSNIMKDRNREDSRIAFEQTLYGQQRQFDFNERMSNTAWQRGVTDMKAAGLNPMLAYAQGPSSSPQGGTAPGVQPHSSLVSGGANSSMQYQTAATTKLLGAQADKTEAEADAIRATTPVNIERMKQEIAESIERIQDIQASVTERTASASRQYQQVENLKAELPRIQEDTKRIIQHARNFAADTTLKTAQEKDVQQRIKANLPEIERLQRDLNLAIERINLPGKELDADARQSFVGILGAYLKALIPIQGLVGAIPMGRSTGPSTGGTIQHKGQRGGPDIHRR